MPRVAVALSAAALVVALLGATPLGNAAERTVKHAFRARQAQSSERGPRGRRGPRGPRGPRGFQGPPGEKGEPGSPTDGFEARSTTPVEIWATSAETATTVLASAPLQPGKYAFGGQVVLRGAGAALVTCQAHGPGQTGPRLGVPATLRVGSASDAVRDGTVPLAFAAAFATAGPVYVGCWLDNAAAPRPTATASLVAVTVLNLTQSGA